MDTPLGLYTHIIVDGYDAYRLNRKALYRGLTVQQRLFNVAMFFNYSLRFLSV